MLTIFCYNCFDNSIIKRKFALKNRLIALLLIITSLFALFSCGKEDKYPPIESTDEEKKTVMTLSIDEEKYQIPYELYRAFFLQLKKSVDGGDESVWTSENKAEFIEKIDSMIISRIGEIYAVFHLAAKAGIDPYSESINTRVREYIIEGVEGGGEGNVIFNGFNGDYEAYLASLKALYLNYSVQDLLIRYTITLSELTLYYAGNPDDNDPKKEHGALKYTSEDVKSFYDSEESVRVIRAYFSKDAFTEKRVGEIRDSIAAKESHNDVANYIIQYSLTSGEDIKNGEIIGKYSLDDRYYGDITEAAFALGIGETSEVITLLTENEEGYAVIYRTDKNDEHFEKCYSSISMVYAENEIGKLLFNAQNALIESAEYKDVLKSLDRASISMD